MSNPSKTETKTEEVKKTDTSKVIELDFGDAVPWLLDRIIFLARSGSRSYGTSTSESDEDYKGIVIPTLPYFFGCGMFKFEQAISKSPDVTLFDIRKFVRLAAKANPNILEMLFVAPEDILICHPLMQKLIEHRDLFVTQLVRNSFSGYAAGAIKAIQKSMIDPPVRENSKRAKLVDQFGFDTKDAAHVVRLMRMGLEIIEGKGVIVKRPDAEELLSIREGAWEPSQIFTYAAEMEAKIQDAMKKCKLPVAPDEVQVDSLCTAIVQASFSHEIKIPVMATGFQHQTWNFDVGMLNAKKLTTKEQEEA
jgi:predicted nucleotidyltransferase